ncbi:MAG: hypothetical protein LBS57_00075 [Treponema sp.]|jgi:hypothetical protein|nr:hypothetical protein [Treponema sp.]
MLTVKGNERQAKSKNRTPKPLKNGVLFTTPLRIMLKKISYHYNNNSIYAKRQVLFSAIPISEKFKAWYGLNRGY